MSETTNPKAGDADTASTQAGDASEPDAPKARARVITEPLALLPLGHAAADRTEHRRDTQPLGLGIEPSNGPRVQSANTEPLAPVVTTPAGEDGQRRPRRTELRKEDLPALYRAVAEGLGVLPGRAAPPASDVQMYAGPRPLARRNLTPVSEPRIVLRPSVLELAVLHPADEQINARHSGGTRDRVTGGERSEPTAFTKPLGLRRPGLLAIALVGGLAILALAVLMPVAMRHARGPFPGTVASAASPQGAEKSPLNAEEPPSTAAAMPAAPIVAASASGAPVPARAEVRDPLVAPDRNVRGSNRLPAVVAGSASDGVQPSRPPVTDEKPSHEELK